MVTLTDLLTLPKDRLNLYGLLEGCMSRTHPIRVTDLHRTVETNLITQLNGNESMSRMNKTRANLEYEQIVKDFLLKILDAVVTSVPQFHSLMISYFK